MPRPADKTHSHNWVNCRYHYIVYSALIAHVYLPSLNIKTMLSKVKLVEDIYMCTTGAEKTKTFQVADLFQQKLSR